MIDALGMVQCHEVLYCGVSFGPGSECRQGKRNGEHTESCPVAGLVENEGKWKGSLVPNRDNSAARISLSMGIFFLGERSNFHMHCVLPLGW